MKKLTCFIMILLIGACAFVSCFKYKVSFNNVIPDEKTINRRGNFISFMYTEKSNGDYVANYGVYDVHLNKFKIIYSRINHHYSDFAFDNKNTTLYYSDLKNKQYNIYKVDLNKRSYVPVKVSNNNVNGDVFSLNKDSIVFRSFDKVYGRHTIGTYDLKSRSLKIWDNEDKDSTIYNFYCNIFNNKIYTIERSLKEMHTSKFPHIPRHRIIQYSQNGDREKEVYSTDKFIDNISVDNDGKRVLFDATDIEGNKPVKKIYMLDFNSLKERIMIEPKSEFEKYTIVRMKMPQFSPDGKGFYFLGSDLKSAVIERPEGSVPITSNSIYYYKFSTKNIFKIFEVPNASINIYNVEVYR